MFMPTVPLNAPINLEVLVSEWMFILKRFKFFFHQDKLSSGQTLVSNVEAYFPQ